MVAIGLIDRYLWRQLRGLFVFGVSVFTTLLVFNHSFLLTRLAFQHGAPLGTAIELSMYRLPYFLAFSFPMATLLAVLMAISRLSDGQEITAMRTSGISLKRIAVSVVSAGLLVSALTFILNEGVVPPAEDRYRIAFAGFLRQPTAVEQQQVLFREQQEGVESVYYIRRFLTEAGRMEGVVVNQFEGGRLLRIIEAPHAMYLDGAWIFRNGKMYLFTGSTTVTTTFERLRVGLRRTPREIGIPQKEPSEMTIRELRAYMSVLRRSGESIARFNVELQSKIAFPLSAMLFSLLAVPLGLRPHRSGVSIGFGLTIVVLLVYYLMISVTVTLGQGGRLHPIAAAWLPNLVLATGGILLLRRADR